MPGHRLRKRRANGLTSGDLVRYDHPHHGTVKGYAVMGNRCERTAALGVPKHEVRRFRSYLTFVILAARHRPGPQQRLPASFRR